MVEMLHNPNFYQHENGCVLSRKKHSKKELVHCKLFVCGNLVELLPKSKNYQHLMVEMLMLQRSLQTLHTFIHSFINEV